MIAAAHDSKFGAHFKDNIVKRDDYDKESVSYHYVLSSVIDFIEGFLVIQRKVF